MIKAARVGLGLEDTPEMSKVAPFEEASQKVTPLQSVGMKLLIPIIQLTLHLLKTQLLMMLKILTTRP